jgi:hypothetical protein
MTNKVSRVTIGDNSYFVFKRNELRISDKVNGLNYYFKYSKSILKQKKEIYKKLQELVDILED